jgi:spore maturation protein CgeB
MKKLKIIFCLVRYKLGIKNKGESSEYFYWVRPLEELGHKVFVYEIDKYLQGTNLGNADDDGDLYNFALKVEADWVFLNDYTNLAILPDTWRKIAAAGIKTSCWFGDDNHKYDNYTKNKAKNFTNPITCDHFSVNRYHEDDLPRPVLSQWGADYYPLLKHADKHVYDISFVGVYSQYRHYILKQLIKAGFKVEFFGDGWNNKNLSQTEMFEVFNSSKINLSLEKLNTNYDLRYLISFPRKLGSFLKDQVYNRPVIHKQIKKRPFDIAMANGFQLVEYVPFIEEYFDIQNEIKIFTSIDELIFFIDYFLKNDDERIKYIDAAFKRTLHEHTMKTRLENVITSIF